MRTIYISWYCELGHLHPFWEENKCTMNDCTIALGIKSTLEVIWEKITKKYD